jgi:hypothetical protein
VSWDPPESAFKPGDLGTEEEGSTVSMGDPVGSTLRKGSGRRRGGQKKTNLLCKALHRGQMRSVVLWLRDVVQGREGSAKRLVQSFPLSRIIQMVPGPYKTSNLNFSPFSPGFSPRFLEKNLAHFCSGNCAGHAPGRSGNFNVRYLICFWHGTYMFIHDLLTLEHGIATGPDR